MMNNAQVIKLARAKRHGNAANDKGHVLVSNPSIHVRTGQKIIFTSRENHWEAQFTAGTPFVLGNNAPAPATINQNNSPDNAPLELFVGLGKKGVWEYVVTFDKGSGDEISDDPQVMVDDDGGAFFSQAKFVMIGAAAGAGLTMLAHKLLTSKRAER